MENEFGIFLKGPRDNHLKIGYPRPAGGQKEEEKKNKLPTSMLILEFNCPRQIHHRSCLPIIDCREYTRVFNTCQKKRKTIKVDMASRVKYVDDENYILTTRDLFIFRSF